MISVLTIFSTENAKYSLRSEQMTDLIKREDAIRAIDETLFIRRPILPHYLKAKINIIPSAEELIYEEMEKADIEAKAYAKGFKEGLEARKQGEWICEMTKSQDQARDRWVIESVVLYCSECKGESVKMTKFCPNCGADMRGADDEKI